MTARVLIVEDNPTNMELMAYLIAAHGYEVERAPSAKDGLDVLEARKIDIVLSDIQLSNGIDGTEFARLVKARPVESRMPIIAVTALAMVGDRDRIMEAGFDGYIAKPLEPRTFVRQVEVHLPPRLRSNKVMETEGTNTEERHPVRAVGSGHRILIIDDVPENINYLRDTLEMTGYNVATATTGRKALELCGEFLPDLILADLHLYNERAFDLLKEVRKREELREVPFIVISSTSTRQALAEEAYENGAQAFLFRPVSPEVLLLEVAAQLQGGTAE